MCNYLTDQSKQRSWFENFDIDNINTPVNFQRFHHMLKTAEYDPDKIRFLIEGFQQGFDIGYKGTTLRQDTAKNLPFTVGNKLDLWEKLMKEVELGRVAGPFPKVPYHNFIQSPIGLVPKAGNKTRLIFHLSFDFPSGHGSLNANIPKELCSVKYNDLDVAVKYCLELLQTSNNFAKIIYFSKTDMVSAFRLVPCRVRDFRWLVMMAYDPRDGRQYFFLDKNLPFGCSVSCYLFQEFSDGISHISRHVSQHNGFLVNYLDDFLFISLDQGQCNMMLHQFITICDDIGVTVAPDKTEEADTHVTFLGIVLDGVRHVLVIPEIKKNKAINLLQWITEKTKAKVKELQSLAGMLNFLHRAIHPGRAFTRQSWISQLMPQRENFWGTVAFSDDFGLFHNGQQAL